jgi:ribosomal protein S18 acetylase RimI-like enzyme
MPVAHVWLAGEGEAEAVAELMAGFRDHMGRSEPSLDSLRVSAVRLIADPHTEFLLGSAEEGGEPAGICQLRFRHAIWTGANDCWLEDLFIRADARRAGLGRALVGEALERARARGCRRVELDVDDDNESAIALYEAMGFSRESKPPGRNLLMGARLP